VKPVRVIECEGGDHDDDQEEQLKVHGANSGGIGVRLSKERGCESQVLDKRRQMFACN
jgi:hypothetical protein